jgi:benzoyl-CoA reductase subunit C
MVLASQVIDKEDHNRFITKLLEGELNGRLKDRIPGPRLMIIGSEDDDINLIKLIEGEGATIVCDDHCTGTRYFWDEIQINSDPMFALVKRYVNRTPCPSKDWPEHRRFGRILEFIKAFRVDGVILIQQKFCDPHECDKVALLKMLTENGIKTLELELDVTLPLGPFRIRVDAFLETMAEDELF